MPTNSPNSSAPRTDWIPLSKVKSKLGVIDLGSFTVAFDHPRTKAAHRMGLMAVVNRHLLNMKEEIEKSVKNVNRITKAKPSFDIYL